MIYCLRETRINGIHKLKLINHHLFPTNVVVNPLPQYFDFWNSIYTYVSVSNECHACNKACTINRMLGYFGTFHIHIPFLHYIIIYIHNIYMTKVTVTRGVDNNVLMPIIGTFISVILL